jgi:tellurite resistance protein TehA-like permease
MFSRFSFVFPNTAMVTATQAIGKAFDASAIQVFGTVLACILIVVWIFVFGMMIRAFWLKRLLWPSAMDGSEISTKKWENGAESAQGLPNGGGQV